MPLRKFLPLASLLLAGIAIAGSDLSSSLQIHNKKIRSILAIQDGRTGERKKLLAFMTDKDPAVRYRTVIAFASLQDTIAVPALVTAIDDPDPDVSRAAVYAVGQTAGVLSADSRDTLGRALMMNRAFLKYPISIDGQPLPGSLAEEMGKFTTPALLREMTAKIRQSGLVAIDVALAMGIARSAIRGVIDPSVTDYLAGRCRLEGAVPWQFYYALQRIGDSPVTKNYAAGIAKHLNDAEPLVRMQVAVLLGKLRDSVSSLGPLIAHARSDADWRVRVNAIKALAGFLPRAHPGTVACFRDLFTDTNQSVALSAITGFGGNGIATGEDSAFRGALAMLRRIAENRPPGYRWQLRSEAAIALAKTLGDRALPSVGLTADMNPHCRAGFIEALGLTGARRAAGQIFEVCGDKDPELARAGLESVRELCRRNPADTVLRNSAYDQVCRSLMGSDVSVRTTAAEILGDSLFLRTTSVSLLCATIDQLHFPNDIEAFQEICSTLRKINDRRAVAPLEKLLHHPESAVVRAAAEALSAMTGKVYRGSDAAAGLLAEPDFQLLEQLADTVRVKIVTSRGEILLELYPSWAPMTVLNFVTLAKRKTFFPGTLFHRVVPNFVLQGGDPRGDGWGGPGYSLRSEFFPATYSTGSVGMASSGKDTEGSQFFITHSPQPHLDGRYTVFGRVIRGMAVADAIQIDDTVVDVDLLP